MIEILHRYTRAVLYSAANAETILEAWERDADLGGAYLRGANLRGADLGGANLRGANLRDADLRDADLGGANLRGANLRDADLGGANLRGAYLRDADLGGADLRDADLGGANLRGANGLFICIRGSRNPITAFSRDVVGVGCLTKPLVVWLEIYETVGIKNQYTAEQIAEYGGYLRAIDAAFQAREPKP